jgi:hypothetical protein
MNHLGHCRALQLIQVLPDRFQPLALKVARDHSGDIGLSRRNLLIGVFGQLLERVGVHVLDERDLQTRDASVGVVTFHFVSIAFAG